MSKTQRTLSPATYTGNQLASELLNQAPPLVLESNGYMRNLLATLLRDAGAQNVLTVSDVSSALDTMRQQTPGLVLADWSYDADPREDRIKFVRRMRAASRAAYHSTPVILLSPARGRSEIEQARDAGVTEFLIKPIAPTTLVERLRFMEKNMRPFVQSPRFSGPDRRRRANGNQSNFKRRVDVSEGQASAMQAAHAASIAVARDTLQSGDPLAVRVGKSLQRFIAQVSDYTAAEEEVVDMHRAALARLAQMIDDGNPLRHPVVEGLERVVAKRMHHI
jgi:two-component system chemotaxis response regulator CheY